MESSRAALTLRDANAAFDSNSGRSCRDEDEEASNSRAVIQETLIDLLSEHIAGIGLCADHGFSVDNHPKVKWDLDLDNEDLGFILYIQS